jgi:hypothetical protein
MLAEGLVPVQETLMRPQMCCGDSTEHSEDQAPPPAEQPSRCTSCRSAVVLRVILLLFSLMRRHLQCVDVWVKAQ